MKKEEKKTKIVNAGKFHKGCEISQGLLNFVEPCLRI